VHAALSLSDSALVEPPGEAGRRPGALGQTGELALMPGLQGRALLHDGDVVRRICEREVWLAFAVQGRIEKFAGNLTFFLADNSWACVQWILRMYENSRNDWYFALERESIYLSIGIISSLIDCYKANTFSPPRLR